MTYTYIANAPSPPTPSPNLDALSASEIAHQLGGNSLAAPDGWCRAPCPAHSETGLNLSLKSAGPGRLAVKCWSRGCDPTAILRAIDARLGTRFGRPDAAADFADADAAIPGPLNGAETYPEAAALDELWRAEEVGYETMLRTEAARDAAERCFEAARPIQPGDLADQYLRRRGIALERYPAALRRHSALWHAETRSTWPALVAKVTAGTGQLVTLHRTFLSAETAGKAPIDPVRKLFSPMRGGAIRLFDPGSDVLLVGEGIETTLSALVLSRWSYAGWSAISTSGLVTLQVPPRFRRVLIAGDNDASGAGLRAARALAKRLRAAGRRVDIHLPQKAGSDWLDVLVEQGEAA